MSFSLQVVTAEVLQAINDLLSGRNGAIQGLEGPDAAGKLKDLIGQISVKMAMAIPGGTEEAGISPHAFKEMQGEDGDVVSGAAGGGTRDAEEDPGGTPEAAADAEVVEVLEELDEDEIREEDGEPEFPGSPGTDEPAGGTGEGDDPRGIGSLPPAVVRMTIFLA